PTATSTLSLHDALPIWFRWGRSRGWLGRRGATGCAPDYASCALTGEGSDRRGSGSAAVGLSRGWLGGWGATGCAPGYASCALGRYRKSTRLNSSHVASS